MKNNEFRKMMIYEIYPTSFYDSDGDGIGDLKGIRLKLDHIAELGFNAIWLNPFYLSPFRDGGYDVADFFAVDPRFGTIDDFKDLIKEAHDKGISVLIDLIPGHASVDNKDFLESARPERNEKSDLFIWSDNPWQRAEGLINGMYDRHGSYLVNFFAHQPAFNYGYKEIKETWQLSYKDERTYQTREYLLKVMRFWLEKGADGFRVDMADSLVKNDEDKSVTIEVWNWLFERIRKEYPDAFFISEWSDPKRSFSAGFDADFVLDHWDNFYHRLFRSDENTRGKAMIKGGNDPEFILKDLKERFSQMDNGYLSLISGNHDTWRIANYLNDEQLRVFYLFLFSLPGIPCVLYGDELGMKTMDLPSKDGGYQRTGTRIPMIWNDDEPYHGFTKGSEPYLPFDPENSCSVIRAINDEDSLYHFIRKLTGLRKEIADLSDPEMTISEKGRVLIFDRGAYQLIMNLSDHDLDLTGEVIISSSDTKAKLLAGSAALIKKADQR